MARLRVQVVYALAQSQEIAVLDMPRGASVREAVETSGIAARHPEIGSQGMRVGISGRQVRFEQMLREGDRIEVLRPLAADPREARRRRARRQR